MSDPSGSAGSGGGDPEGASASPGDPDGATDVETRAAVLAAENRRLRDRLAATRRTDHRRAGAGLVACGVLALLGAAAFPDARQVLAALGGTGVFSGLLVFYLTPERFVAADVGADVYRVLARDRERLVDELGLSDRRVYLPRESDVRLYVPQRRADDLPDPAALDTLLVIAEDPRRRGLALRPVGEPLYDELGRAGRGPALAGALDSESGSKAGSESAADPDPDPGPGPNLDLGGGADPGPRTGSGVGPVARELADATVEALELADAVGTEIDPDAGRLTVEFRGAVYETGTWFDRPDVSLIAVGLARRLDRPIDVDVSGTGEADDTAGDVVTFRWEPGAGSGTGDGGAVTGDAGAGDASADGFRWQHSGD